MYKSVQKGLGYRGFCCDTPEFNPNANRELPQPEVLLKIPAGLREKWAKSYRILWGCRQFLLMIYMIVKFAFTISPV